MWGSVSVNPDESLFSDFEWIFEEVWRLFASVEPDLQSNGLLGAQTLRDLVR